MSDVVQKISPLEYITDHDPVDEVALDSSSWFKTETVELNFGEYVGRPSEDVVLRSSMLSYFFSNGWYVDAVLGSGRGGSWRHVSSSKVKTTGTAKSSATNEATSYSRSSGLIEWAPSSSGTSSGSSEGESDSSGSSDSNVSSDGAPFWFTYTRIRLKRRKMQSELVLQDMINQFTKAYNEGRKINDQRYDELVALYSIMLSRTEDEANAWNFSPVDFSSLTDELMESLQNSITDFDGKVGSIPEDFLQNREDEVNRKFDAELAKSRSEMVSRGIFNTTVWDSVAAGIEKNRQYALNDLSDKTVMTKIDVYGKIVGIKADVTGKIIDSAVRVMEALQKRMLGPTEIRNTVFKWMLDFMERREDDYPGLDQLVTISDRLGYGDGATGGASVS